MNVAQICCKKKQNRKQAVCPQRKSAQKKIKKKQREGGGGTQTHPSELGPDLGEHLEHWVCRLVLHLHQLVQLLGDLDPVDLQGETLSCQDSWGEWGEGGSGSVHSP